MLHLPALEAAVANNGKPKPNTASSQGMRALASITGQRVLPAPSLLAASGMCISEESCCNVAPIAASPNNVLLAEKYYFHVLEKDEESAALPSTK